MAAYAPLLASAGSQGSWNEPGLGEPSRVFVLKPEIEVKSVDVDGQQVLVAARGGVLRAQAMERAAQGVARILKAA
jgi:hypothetical protein